MMAVHDRGADEHDENACADEQRFANSSQSEPLGLDTTGWIRKLQMDLTNGTVANGSPRSEIVSCFALSHGVTTFAGAFVRYSIMAVPAAPGCSSTIGGAWVLLPPAKPCGTACAVTAS
jgi:hypothetical protein